MSAEKPTDKTAAVAVNVDAHTLQRQHLATRDKTSVGLLFGSGQLSD